MNQQTRAVSRQGPDIPGNRLSRVPGSTGTILRAGHLRNNAKSRYDWAVRSEATTMRLHWPGFLTRFTALSASKYNRQSAPEFLFERRPFTFDCAGRSPAQSAGNRCEIRPAHAAPYLMTHAEELSLSISEVPALTITADPSNMIAVGGSDRSDWFIRFCARGEGNSEAEAREQLQQINITRRGGVVSLSRRPLDHGPRAMSYFLLEAPTDAETVIHASFAPVEVRDMNGPVRVTASHARAKILETTGQVDADAFVIDFAGSRGRVSLSAEAEINLRITASKFEGTLMAWAQRPVRMLVPIGFVTPFQATVKRSKDFVCRADLCPKVKHERKYGLHVFTYAGDGSAAPELVQLYSEQSTVVIDNIAAKN